MSKTKRWVLGVLIGLNVLVLTAYGILFLAFAVQPRAGLMDVAGDWCQHDSDTKFLRLTGTGDIKFLHLADGELSRQLGLDPATVTAYDVKMQSAGNPPTSGQWHLDTPRRPAFLPRTSVVRLVLNGHTTQLDTSASGDEWLLDSATTGTLRRCGLPGY